jgi:hypothetical protein
MHYWEPDVMCPLQTVYVVCHDRHSLNRSQFDDLCCLVLPVTTVRGSQYMLISAEEGCAACHNASN